MKNLILKLRTLFFSSILILLCSNSCFESDPPDRCNWEQEYSAYSNSIDAFLNNPTPATCQNLKTRALQMIDKFEDCEDFTPYVTDLRSTWNSIDCTDF
jgi:hypothetical protein